MDFDKLDAMETLLALFAGFALGAIGGYYVLNATTPAAPVTTPAAAAKS